jgi:Tol biopolymer transport system component
MNRALLLVLLAAVAVGTASSARADALALQSSKLIDCTCYDLVVAATDRPPRTIFHNTGQNLYGVSPNRRLMAFAGAQARLYVSPTNSHAKRLVGPAFSRWAVFSPDGKRLAYGADNRCDVCIVSVNGGTPQRFPVAGAVRPVAWSPNGKRLAFVRRDGPVGSDRGTLMVANLDGSNAKSLVRGENFTAGTSLGVKLAWSPPGDRIAYLSNSRVHIIRIRDRRDVAVGFGQAPVWSPNGRLLAFSRLLSHRVAVARYDGRGVHELDPLSTDGYGMGVSWSPKSRFIAYARYAKTDRYQLAIARPDGTQRRVLTTEPENVEIGPTYWSRDGETILYGTYLQQGE